MAEKYRVIVVHAVEFPETRYNYDTKANEETGRKLLREDQIYTQDFENTEGKLENIIKSVNGL